MFGAAVLVAAAPLLFRAAPVDAEQGDAARIQALEADNDEFRHRVAVAEVGQQDTDSGNKRVSLLRKLLS